MEADTTGRFRGGTARPPAARGGAHVIGVKYCGGCNPRIDRRAVFRGLGDLLGADRLEVMDPERPYAAGLLLCGCERACADRPAVRRRAPLWVVVGGPAVDGEPVAEALLAEAVAAKIKSGNATPLSS
ncbi:MAG TPA: hypothetical protein P5019_09985 [Syntrophales bacterium]|nr:hypothetical protein [Syntrophales bacterium]